MKAVSGSRFGARSGFLCALAVGLCCSAALLLGRLPQSAEFMLPRRPGFAFFKLAIRAAQSPGPKAGVWWAALAAILLTALAALWRLFLGLSSSWPPKSRSLVSWVLRAAAGAAGLCALALASRFALVLGLDLIQNAWFPPQSMDLLEPLAAFFLFFSVAAAFLGSAAAALRCCFSAPPWRGALGSAAAWAAAFMGPILVLHALASFRYDIRHKTLAGAAGFSGRARSAQTVVMLTEKEGRPDYEVYPMETPYAPESLEAVERYLAGRRTVFTRAALRFLYDGYAVRMDAQRLRPALFLGHLEGDPVARLLLLDNLACAPPDSGLALFLAGLSDERELRIGPRAAVQLSLAYAHMGDSGRAAYWQERASQGEGAIPKGLVPLPSSGGALKPGTLRGRVFSKKPVRVGLYARGDSSSPYVLSPVRLVASAETDSRGRFEFLGLAAGDYYLALSLDNERRDRASVRLRGHRGDIRLSPEHPRVELPPLELRW